MLALASGDVFERDYRVVKPLSEGGMGMLYVVQQISTGKKRALKLMAKGAGNDDEARRRFTQEAQVGSLIESEHIVEVIAAGVDEASNTPWLVMELLEGEDLGSIVEREECLPPNFIRDLFQQLCHALGAAHDLPVVHRDLKPENVFLARSRVAHSKFLVKLLDFGIAKILVDGVNSTGSVGTPLWMAPEQARPSAVITPATDVWALGLMAFNVLTSKIYWLEGGRGEKADVMALLNEVLFEELPLASVRAKELGAAHELPKGFDEWFALCVVRDPAKRFPNAREAWRALEPIIKEMDDFGGEGEFTLRVKTRITTGDNPIPSGAIARTGGPVSVSKRPQRKIGLGVIIAGVVTLLSLAIVVMATAKKTDTPQVGSTTPPPPSVTATTPVATDTTVATAPPSTSVPAASTTTTTTAGIKPVHTATTAHSTTAPASTSAAPKASNPLNMVLQ
jgi:serine/threonine protein kinase